RKFNTHVREASTIGQVAPGIHRRKRISSKWLAEDHPRSLAALDLGNDVKPRCGVKVFGHLLTDVMVSHRVDFSGLAFVSVKVRGASFASPIFWQKVRIMSSRIGSPIFPSPLLPCCRMPRPLCHLRAYANKNGPGSTSRLWD